MSSGERWPLVLATGALAVGTEVQATSRGDPCRAGGQAAGGAAVHAAVTAAADTTPARRQRLLPGFICPADPGLHHSSDARSQRQDYPPDRTCTTMDSHAGPNDSQTGPRGAPTCRKTGRSNQPQPLTCALACPKSGSSQIAMILLGRTRFDNPACGWYLYTICGTIGPWRLISRIRRPSDWPPRLRY